MSVLAVVTRHRYERVTDCAVCGDLTVRRPRAEIAMCWTCVQQTTDDPTQPGYPTTDPRAQTVASKPPPPPPPPPIWRFTVVTNGGKS